jgi:hypothetical protein
MFFNSINSVSRAQDACIRCGRVFFCQFRLILMFLLLVCTVPVLRAQTGFFLISSYVQKQDFKIFRFLKIENALL